MAPTCNTATMRSTSPPPTPPRTPVSRSPLPSRSALPRARSHSPRPPSTSSTAWSPPASASSTSPASPSSPSPDGPPTPRLGNQQGDASDDAGSPGLVLVREPDQLGGERAHPQLAFSVRLVELAAPHRHVAADDDRAPARLDDDHLRAACVARRRDESEPGQ